MIDDKLIHILMLKNHRLLSLLYIMISLVNFIKRRKTNNRTIFNESYEDFCSNNKNIVSTFDDYVKSFYKDNDICRKFNFDVKDITYDSYINDLYETLLSSSSNDYFIKCFEKKIHEGYSTNRNITT